ncbi:PEP-CTERM sorting domain-containing protein [Pontiella sp.]
MEQTTTVPFCAPEPSNLIPMLVVIAAFVLAGWAVRRWRKKRRSDRK